jgi:hypothetical protein
LGTHWTPGSAWQIARCRHWSMCQLSDALRSRASPECVPKRELGNEGNTINRMKHHLPNLEVVFFFQNSRLDYRQLHVNYI